MFRAATMVKIRHIWRIVGDSKHSSSNSSYQNDTVSTKCLHQENAKHYVVTGRRTPQQINGGHHDLIKCCGLYPTESECLFLSNVQLLHNIVWRFVCIGSVRMCFVVTTILSCQPIFDKQKLIGNRLTKRWFRLKRTYCCLDSYGLLSRNTSWLKQPHNNILTTMGQSI